MSALKDQLLGSRAIELLRKCEAGLTDPDLRVEVIAFLRGLDGPAPVRSVVNVAAAERIEKNHNDAAVRMKLARAGEEP